MNSFKIQAVVRSIKKEIRTKRSDVQKTNSLKNKQMLLRINTYLKTFSKKKLKLKKLMNDKSMKTAKLFSNVLNKN